MVGMSWSTFSRIWLRVSWMPIEAPTSPPSGNTVIWIVMVTALPPRITTGEVGAPVEESEDGINDYSRNENVTQDRPPRYLSRPGQGRSVLLLHTAPRQLPPPPGRAQEGE